jgi:hypothetical protein
MPETAPVPHRDALLTSARWLLAFLIGVMVLAAGFMLLGIGAMLTVQRDVVMAKIAAAGAPASSFGLVMLGFLLIFGLLLLTAKFLLELRRIVDSVGDGDPFHPENADRLARMGWMVLGGKAVWVAVVAIAHWAAQYLDGRRLPELNLLSGLLLVLVLFILARVFRVGAAMRDDLEGTV